MTATEQAIDIGHGMSIRSVNDPVYGWIGILLIHKFPGSRRICSKLPILFDVPVVRKRYPGESLWEVHSPLAAPLTLWPSITCYSCRRHGFIFEGRWEPDDE